MDDSLRFLILSQGGADSWPTLGRTLELVADVSDDVEREDGPAFEVLLRTDPPQQVAFSTTDSYEGHCVCGEGTSFRPCAHRIAVRLMCCGSEASGNTGAMTGQPFRIRLADPSDARGCAFVHHTAWVETYSELVSATHWETDTLTRRTEMWERSLDGGKTVTVAESEEQIIGIAITNAARKLGDHEPVRELELSSLYVLAAQHGTGVGQALLETVLPSSTPGQLWVLEGNPRARRFYERNGFVFDGTRYVDEHLNLVEVRHVR